MWMDNCSYTCLYLHFLYKGSCLYQEETAKKYIKVVSKKYKERNEINAKSSKKEMKEQQKALKREKKERKREERNLKKEKNKMANKGKIFSKFNI